MSQMQGAWDDDGVRSAVKSVTAGWSSIESELNSAKNGDIEPLLKMLRENDIPTSVTSSGEYEDATLRNNDSRWYDVLAAYSDGDLTDAQMEQCRTALGC